MISGDCFSVFTDTYDAILLTDTALDNPQTVMTWYLTFEYLVCCMDDVNDNSDSVWRWFGETLDLVDRFN